MKTCIILVCIIFGLSCKKSSDPLDNFANNQVSIKVYYANGDSTAHSFQGIYAPMYLSTIGQKFGAEGKINPNERRIIFGVQSSDSTNSIVSCLYFPESANPDSYSTGNSLDPGFINFTRFSDNLASGSFVAKCMSMSDTILIKGTFSGYYNN